MGSKFIWAGKHLRIRAAILQQGKAHGGIALPNIAVYLYAALLGGPTMAEYEKWEWEQIAIPS